MENYKVDHDPYCKSYYPDLLPAQLCAWCSVIKRVREDEKENLDLEYWRGYHNGQQDGYTELAKEQEAFLDYHNGFLTEL
jgi:hypothetical protein